MCLYQQELCIFLNSKFQLPNPNGNILGSEVQDTKKTLEGSVKELSIEERIRLGQPQIHIP